MTTKKKGSPKAAGAGKKAPAKKPSGKKKSSSSRHKSAGNTQADLVSQLKKISLGILSLVAVCLILAMVADLLLRQPSGPPATEYTGTPKPGSPAPTGAPKEAPAQEKPAVTGQDSQETDHLSPQSGLMVKNGRPVLYEVFEKTGEPPEKVPGSRELTKQEDGLAEIALIIDDIGYDQQMAMALYDLEPNISFSVLPWSPYGRAVAGILKQRGAQILLHLPMEPVQYPEVDPGPGALLTGMSPDALIAQLERNLDEVPGATGVNNHMGSRLTTQASQMYQVFSILKKRNLFFVDSMTARDSQCRAAARLLQVRFGQRDVFLDNVQEQAYITGQFAQLKKIARKYGHAIGIGHPYPATLETLTVELPKIREKIRIVPVSRMVAIPG